MFCFVFSRSNGINGKTKPVKTEGKFISQIKKNLSQGRDSEGDQEDSLTGKKPTKNTEKSKTSSGSVFSRLSEPTISSAKKSVKPVETAKPNSIKGGKTSVGKDSPKVPAPKENTATKKQPPPVLEKPKKSQSKEEVVEKKESSKDLENKPKQQYTREEEALKKDSENPIVEEVEHIEYPEILEFNKE